MAKRKRSKKRGEEILQTVVLFFLQAFTYWYYFINAFQAKKKRGKESSLVSQSLLSLGYFNIFNFTISILVSLTLRMSNS